MLERRLEGGELGRDELGLRFVSEEEASVWSRKASMAPSRR